MNDKSSATGDLQGQNHRAQVRFLEQFLIIILHDLKQCFLRVMWNIESKIMQEVRQSERVKSFLRAQIIFNQRMSTIDCVVKNISPTGAKLALNEALSIPSEFDLFIPQKGRTFRARLVWRDADAVGVEFMTAEAQAAEARELAAGSNLDTRLHALEVQNAELKARIRELSKRLEDLGQDPNMAA